MKLVLFAHQIVGLEVFNYLVEAFPQDLVGVVTVEENQIYQEAKLKKIPVKIFDKNNQNFKKNEFELGLLAWWPYIIKEPLLSMPKHGFINFHPSLLPFNRGKHYNFWALVEQSPFGVSLHKIDKGVDTGEIVAQKSIDYDWEDNGETLYYKAQKEIVNLFKSSYPLIRQSQLVTTPQNLSEGSFHLSSEMDLVSKIDIDKSYTAQQLLNLLRARTFQGHPACWFEDIDGQKYEVKIQIKRKQ